MRNTFDTTAKSLNRATICDGKLFYHYVVEPLGKNDDTLLGNVNDIYTPLESVYDTVYDNSANNFDNKGVSGFSAIYCNTTANIGASRIASTFKFKSTDYVDVVAKPSTNTFEINADLAEFAKSYYARAMYAGGYVDDNSVAFDNSSATNNGFAFSKNSSADSHGVIFARGPSTASDFGVVYSLASAPYNTGIATHSSVSLYGSTAYGKSNIVMYRSQTDDSTVSSLVAYNSTAINANCGIAKHNSTTKGYHAIAEYDSYAETNSIAMHESTAVERSIGVYNATARNNSVSFCSADANGYSIAHDNATAETSSIAMKKDAFASNKSIAFFGATASDKSIAGGYKSRALNSSLCMTFNSESNAENTLAENYSMAFGHCHTASNYSIGMCYGVARDHSFEIIGNANVSSWAFSYATATDCSFAAQTGSCATVSSIAILSATASHQSVSYNGSEANDCSIAFMQSTANDHSIAKFTSIASTSAIAYCNSSATDKSLAMFDSSAYDCSIALFNSTASHSALSLYDNTINIKSDGSVNGLLISDQNGVLYVD